MKSTHTVGMFYCTLCCNTRAFPHMWNMVWNQIFWHLVLSTVPFELMSSYQTSWPLFLNIFTCSHFPSESASSLPLNTFHTTLISKTTPPVHSKRTFIEIINQSPQTNVHRHPDVVMLGVPWWSDMAGHAKLHLLHLLAFLITQKIHPPRQTLSQKWT